MTNPPSVLSAERVSNIRFFHEMKKCDAAEAQRMDITSLSALGYEHHSDIVAICDELLRLRSPPSTAPRVRVTEIIRDLQAVLKVDEAGHSCPVSGKDANAIDAAIDFLSRLPVASAPAAQWVPWRKGEPLPSDPFTNDIFHVRWGENMLKWHPALEGECYVKNFEACGVTAYVKYLPLAKRVPPPYAPPSTVGAGEV